MKKSKNKKIRFMVMIMNKKSILIIAVVTFISFGLYANSAIAQTWVNEIVDSIGSYGGYSSIAIDSSDNLHISYHTGFPDYDLKYATNASGSWVTVTVDSNAEYVASYTSIAIDSSDNVHISYYNGNLKYATNESGSWVTETVDSNLGAGKHTSIAIDSSNNVHISHYDSYNDNLVYVTNASGSWVNKYMSSKSGMTSSIAIDSSDNVYISYRYSYGGGGLNLFTNASGSWVIIPISRTMTTGGFSSIAIDSSDNVHISFRGYGYLEYATNKGVAPGTGNCWNTDWNCEAVDIDANILMMTSIAIDSSDNMHIIYMAKYATNASGSWVTETVDSSGGMSSIAIDSSDNVHISYSDTNLDLKHATNAEQDSDGDGIPDGDGTNPCTGGNTSNCDDNCIVTPNSDQADADNDGIGDVCDTDGVCLDMNSTDGWHLISFTCQPSDSDIQKVLEPISGKFLSVWSYENGSWKFYAPNNPVSDLEKIETGKGYWIYMSEAAFLTIMGSTPSKTISLNQGWNLVGYNSLTSQLIEDALASIDGKYISVWRYKGIDWEFYAPGNPVSDLTTMEPGYGYWISTTEDTTWTLP